MFEGVKFVEGTVAPSVTTVGGDIGHSSAARSFSKRLFDICAAAIVLLALLPFCLITAVCIRLETPGPALFRQRRTGLNGKKFSIYKFRSMTVIEDGGSVAQATSDDERVTRVGRLLRRTSLDEVPQLINILRGEMSFVGPRPHAVAHDVEFALTVPAYVRRFRARPGLTGFAQVRGYRGEIRTREDLQGRIDADIEYIETWSIAHDVTTLIKTLPLMFGDDRAY